MVFTIDLYWSMRSPFCYLALDRLLALDREPDVRINIKHVWPGAMRREGYFDKLDPNYTRYHHRDTARLGEYLGLPYGRPKPDPLMFDRATMAPLPLSEQPHIGRLTALAVLAVEAGAGMAFLDPATRLIWSGTVTDWHLGDHLARAAAGAGLDFDDLAARADAEADRLYAAVTANGDDLRAAGHWGVPCMVLDDEPFFGQDRLELLTWRLNQARQA